MHELAPSLYWMPPDHTVDRPILGAIAGSNATIMVDAGNSPAHMRQFLNELAPLGLPPVRTIILTHSHWDHVFGASALPDAAVVASAETARHLTTMATWTWTDAAIDERVAAGLEIPFCRDMMKAELTPADRAALEIRVPDTTFDASMSIDAGDRIVEVIQVGGDHAADSSIVVVPGVAAFIGDCIYRNLHREPNYYTRRLLFPLLDRLLDIDVEHFVLSHEDAPLTRVAFAERARALKAAGRSSRPVLGTTATTARLAGDHDPEVVSAFRAGRVREAETLPALDIAYARFNAAKTVSDPRDSQFTTKTAGALTVTMDHARDGAYYNRVIGLAADTLADLDPALEHLQDCPAVRIDVNEPVDASVAQALTRRGFSPGERLVWLAAPAAGAAADPRVSRLGPAERDRVRAILELEGAIADDLWASRSPLLCTETFRFFAVEIDGALAALATTYIPDAPSDRGQSDLAILGNAFTRPAYRGRGFQTALLATRRADAAALGIPTVVTDVEPGATSLRNCERSGFSQLGTQTLWIRSQA